MVGGAAITELDGGANVKLQNRIKPDQQSKHEMIQHEVQTCLYELITMIFFLLCNKMKSNSGTFNS